MTDAEQAAAHWDGQVIRLIGARENLVYELSLTNGGRAALRLHRTAYQTADAIRAEIDWCAALAASGLPVASPLAGAGGERLIRLASGRYASATAWVDGVPLGANGQALGGTTAELVALHHHLGRLLANLHATSDANPPHPFPRPAWDIDGLTGPTPVWGRFWEHPAATPDQTETLRLAQVMIRERLFEMQRSGADEGPIHADVVRENVLVAGGQVALIDFDDCGTGFRAYDLGTAMMQNEYEPAREELRDALIAGYAELRPIDAATVEVMTLARACASVGWTMPRLAASDPIHQRHIARAVKAARRMLG